MIFLLSAATERIKPGVDLGTDCYTASLFSGKQIIVVAPQESQIFSGIFISKREFGYLLKEVSQAIFDLAVKLTV